MEGILLYYKSKGKNPEKHKCVLVIGDSGGPYRDEFLMLNKDEKTIKMKVKLADMEKLAQYPRDGSWEFGTRAGKSFRYRSENDVENKRWFDLLDGFVNKRGGVNGNNPSTIQALVLQPPNNQAPPSQTSSNNNSFAMQPQNNNARNDSNKSQQQQQQQQQPIIADGIRNGWDYYNVKIVDTRSTSTICANFLIDDIYEFSLEQYAISLKNKFNVQDNRRVGAELIRSFGFYDGYYCIEFGRRSGFGEGYLTLNSTRTDANRVHRHLYELTRQTFDQLKQEMDREETPRTRNDANGSFENDDEEDEDDDDDDDMMERNRVNQIKYTNVYLQPQQQHQQYQQQAPPNPSQQQQQVKPPPNNNNNNNSYQSQPLQQRPQQPQYLTIIREDNNAPASYHTQQQQPEPYSQSNNNNNRQQQPPPTTSKTANLKTTKVQIHRIEPTNQAQQGGYNNANNNNGPYQRPDYPYPDRSTVLSTSSSVDSDPYQYRPYQTQSPNDEFMRGQQQQDMNVYKAVLVNNVYEPNNNQNTTTAQNSAKSSQMNQKQPPPQQQQQQQQQYTGPKQTQPQQQYQPPPQQQSYYTNNYNTTNGAPTNGNGNGNGNGTAGRIGMNGNNNPSTSYNSYPRTSMITAGMDHSGFSLVEEIEHYESETDESFYEERYVPHYVSNSSRNLSSSAAALEYFQDSGNTVYGKFKL